MTEYWQSLTARERTLIGIAGVLMLLVLTYFAVVRPLGTYVLESERALERAKAVHSQIFAGAREVESLKARGAAARASDNPTSVRVAVAQAARQNGVAISRLQPGENGALTVWVETVPAPTFYAWVESLSRDHGIAPRKAIVQKSTSAGRLRVQLEFGAT